MHIISSHEVCVLVVKNTARVQIENQDAWRCCTKLSNKHYPLAKTLIFGLWYTKLPSESSTSSKWGKQKCKLFYRKNSHWIPSAFANRCPDTHQLVRVTAWPTSTCDCLTGVSLPRTDYCLTGTSLLYSPDQAPIPAGCPDKHSQFIHVMAWPMKNKTHSWIYRSLLQQQLHLVKLSFLTLYILKRNNQHKYHLHMGVAFSCQTTYGNEMNWL